MNEKMMTKKELMAFLGVKSYSTITRMEERHQIPSGTWIGGRYLWFESSVRQAVEVWKRRAYENVTAETILERIADRRSKRRTASQRLVRY